MRIVSIGGGPAGLYFAILMKKADPSHEILVLERNRPDDTFGFGVVFSDATLQELADADRETYQAITRRFYHWDDIDVHYGGEVLRSTGHGFSGLSRQVLLEILQRRARELGVELRFETEVTDVGAYADADLVLGADGVNSTVRSQLADHFRPQIDVRPNKFVWLGTTRPFDAFTFYFRHDEHGLWRVHAYQYDAEGNSTFIVETREETWRAAGMDRAGEEETAAFCEALFAPELRGHRLIRNHSLWRSFPTVRNERWHHGNVLLIGDAAHTAHFSVGSGTRIAMLDAIVLAEEMARLAGRARRGPASARGATGGERDTPSPDAVTSALAAYEERQRPAVESLQRAAQASLQWFEDTERYMRLEPVQFGFTILTRSLRITHENLRLRDPEYIGRVDRWFAERAVEQSGLEIPLDPPPPPMFTPFKLRGLMLANRVAVSPMCQYSAVDGFPNEWHFVHLGSRAIGGAGLVWTEMTDVSPEGRISPGCTGMYRDQHVPAWRRIVEFVHQHSGAKIGMQLGHAGRKASTRFMWEGDCQPLPEADANWPVISPSPIPYYPHSQVPREMTREDMDAVRDDFVRAAQMAEEAGFDLIEIHMAHGYLLASFISPLTNRRDDEYGGPLDNRLRFPIEVLDAVRAVWPDKPLSVRLSAVDWKPGGMTPSDSVEVARALKAHGCDVVDVSAGQTVPDQRPQYGRLFQTPFADRIRNEVGIATMAVGNISSYEDVNTILAAGRADICLLARAHLYDPYWTRHAALALGYELRWPDPYATLQKYRPRFE